MDLGGDGGREAFPDTLFPPGGGAARPERSELPPHSCPGTPHAGTHGAARAPPSAGTSAEASPAQPHSDGGEEVALGGRRAVTAVLSHTGL